MRRTSIAFAATLLAATPIAAQTIQPGTTEVMRIAQYLTDVIGARLTNSPDMRQAEAWTKARFRDWGLANVHKEGFAFGRGWSNDRLVVRMVAPRSLQLVVAPLAWAPGTNGPISGAIILAAFLVNAANADRPLPRVPLAMAPTPADAFYPFGGNGGAQ